MLGFGTLNDLTSRKKLLWLLWPLPLAVICQITVLNRLPDKAKAYRVTAPGSTALVLVEAAENILVHKAVELGFLLVLA
jgi:hypothetical protein